jgi:CRP-like cAMP-binding protein
MAGTTTETASRVMSQFQKEGLIQSGRQWVAIVDQAGLEKAAE